MSMQDTLADMLTRIRNAQAANKKTVELPSSKMKQSVLAVLKKEGYIADFKVEPTEDSANKLVITILLKYYEGRPVIQKIQRVSKPGLRIYRTRNDLPKVMGNLGVAIVSTSQGIMSGKKARSLGIGGEILAVVE